MSNRWTAPESAPTRRWCGERGRMVVGESDLPLGVEEVLAFLGLRRVG